jgi:hypothetical protein
LAVGEETTLNPITFPRLPELGGTVRGDRNELEAHFIELGFDAAQFAELLVAVRSPPAPIKNEDRRFFVDCLGRVCLASVNRSDGDGRYGSSRHQRANFFG